MINSDHKDILGELINIAFGAATALIADLFDNFATLRVPVIDIVPISEINEVTKEFVETEKFYITTQQIRGNFQGETVLVFGEESARNMQLVLESDTDGGTDNLLQNILEISNILGSSCLGKFAELLGAEISFSPPSIEHTDKIIQNVSESPYSMVITISTVLEFKELDIMGSMIIMFSNEMSDKLEKSLDSFLENL